MNVASPRPLEPGARVGGKYRLVRRLAFGGMGEVWIARNLTTGADVALKRCRGDVASEEAALRFRHEARLGAMLSHRSIVRVYDLVEEPDGPPLLVMELLRGETLARRLAARGALPGKEAMAIAIPVLSALAHAHDSGVVHRDVTPANVFLAVDPDGHVTPKLVDFGVAKLPETGVHTLDGRVLGTPRYMAPERIRGSDDLDGRSDLFSLGVVLYEMLTGTCPFAANTPSASLAAVLEAVVDPDPRIEPRVWFELHRALAKRPYERHATARELAEALCAASGETDASLAECLRQSRPSGDGMADPLALTQPSLRVGGHSFVHASLRLTPGGARVARRAGLIVLACIALTGIGLLRHGQTSRSAATAIPTSVATPSLTAAPAPSSTAIPLPQPTQSSIPLASPPPAPQRQARPSRAKPIATTPGF